MCTSSRGKKRDRRASILVLSAFLLVVMIAILAFAIDLGYISLAKTQLQNAADSAALACAATMGQSASTGADTAIEYANKNYIGPHPVVVTNSDITYGTWDKDTNTFIPVAQGISNAVRVTARADSRTSGSVPLFFAKLFNKNSADISASATATCNYRDICFVVDLSGSMNDDTDPNKTAGINSTYPGVGSAMVQAVFDDFGFGSYATAVSESIGKPLGVSSLSALTNTTSSPLLNTKQPRTVNGASYTVPTQYQILSTDTSTVRTKKAYSWVIDEQLAGKSGAANLRGVMRAAKPAPNSADTNNYNYWLSYLSSNSSNIGYKSYVSFMMSKGRDVRPSGSSTLYTPLSINSPDCPYRPDTTQKGNTFNFPPREMPTHASRMAMIDALQIIKERNQNITNSTEADWVSIVTFDLTSDVVVLHPLDSNYDSAMQDSTMLQACSDSQACTSTETGLSMAINHLTTNGRRGANKVVVLLTDGVPNLYSSSSTKISNYITANPNSNYYTSGSIPQNAAMMQAATMLGNNWSVFPVELGLQGNADFMNRIYSITKGETTKTVSSPYDATGNPADYETNLITIFNDIISNPKLHLVQ